VVAGLHEQTHIPRLQDQELARIQRAIDTPLIRAVAHRGAIGSSPMGDGERAQAPWVADDLV